MTSNPLISVVLPVYNCEMYLRECIDSILSQTFRDFELIIINDGSSDGSKDIILSYDDERIVFIENERNLKVIETLNRGIAAARGKYIARMDSDDRCLPDRLKRQYEYMESHPEVDICSSWAYVIDGNGSRAGKIKNPGNPETVKCSLLFTNPVIHPAVFGKAGIFKRFGYSPDAVHIEDFELWNRMSSEGVVISNIEKYLIEYRWHETNISAVNDDAQYRSKVEILKPQVSELVSREVSDDEMYLHEISFRLFSKGRNNGLKTERNILKREREWLSGLSEANKSKKTFDVISFDSFLMSRWIVLCINDLKNSLFLFMPSRFYRPNILSGAFELLRKK